MNELIKLRDDILAEIDGGEECRGCDSQLTEWANRITAMQPFIRQGWQPRYGFPRDGMDIVRSALLEKNVYLQGKNGDVYRVWLDHLGVPMIECVEFNAALPEPPKEPNPDNQPKE